MGHDLMIHYAQSTRRTIKLLLFFLDLNKIVGKGMIGNLGNFSYSYYMFTYDQKLRNNKLFSDAFELQGISE